MISLILLAGCDSASQLEGDFAAWHSSYLEQPEHSITAVVTSVIDDVHSEYTLAYHRDSEEETVEVLAPELIANVKAHMSDDGSRLSFDGVILETGGGIDRDLSPLTALPTFMSFLQDGYVKSLRTEVFSGTPAVVSELELADGSRMTMWQDSATMAPIYATLRSGDVVEIKINLKSDEG